MASEQRIIVSMLILALSACTGVNSAEELAAYDNCAAKGMYLAHHIGKRDYTCVMRAGDD